MEAPDQDRRHGEDHRCLLEGWPSLLRPLAPKAAIEIKDLRVDISKNGGPNPILCVKLCVNPLLVQICDPHINFDHSGFDHGDSFITGQTSFGITEKDSAPFMFEDLSVACELGHDREQGIKIKNLDFTSGDITVNLNENLFLSTKKKSEASFGGDIKESPSPDVTTAKKSQNNKISALMMKPIIPEKGRFLLAAASGRILARSFHSVLHVGSEMIEQALGTGSFSIPETEPEMTWKRVELSVMLEHVQAHVAPTDVDPGAGLQWLPKILRSSPKVKRTGALLERVFMPCQMYFRYTRHKGGTPELKVKPLKELKFNSPNIIATMTSRQFQVMLDVLSNLLFAILPKSRDGARG